MATKSSRTRSAKHQPATFGGCRIAFRGPHRRRFGGFRFDLGLRGGSGELSAQGPARQPFFFFSKGDEAPARHRRGRSVDIRARLQAGLRGHRLEAPSTYCLNLPGCRAGPGAVCTMPPSRIARWRPRVRATGRSARPGASVPFSYPLPLRRRLSPRGPWAAPSSSEFRIARGLNSKSYRFFSAALAVLPGTAFVETVRFGGRARASSIFIWRASCAGVCRAEGRRRFLR